MKKFLFILSILLLAIACEKNPIIDEPTNGVYDPEAMITIKAAPAKGYIGGLTPLEIVEQAYCITWRTNYSDNYYHEHPSTPIRAFSDMQKDFETPALKMFGFDILQPILLEMYPDSEYGMFLRDFIDGRDVFIIDHDYDTIAYVPNEVLINARPLIWQAYCDSNYNEVYRLFDEAFTFIPIEPKK